MPAGTAARPRSRTRNAELPAGLQTAAAIWQPGSTGRSTDTPSNPHPLRELLATPGVAQEWFESGSPIGGPGGGGVTLFAGLTHQTRPASVFWIGRGCRPYGRGLPRELARRSVHLDIDAAADRLWALETVARCAAEPDAPPLAILADGTGFDRVATRRLQLAARSPRVTLILLRPQPERDQLSTAGLRWLLQPIASGHAPSWSVELLRNKTGRHAATGTLRLRAEPDHLALTTPPVPPQPLRLSG